jgi:hypothetical protein
MSKLFTCAYKPGYYPNIIGDDAFAYCGREHTTRDLAEHCKANRRHDDKAENWHVIEIDKGFYDRRWDRIGDRHQ